MKPFPSRLRRLDAALADLPLDEPMLLTELDGFLTGILLSPEPIAPEEWMAVVWGIDDGGLPPFEDPLDVQWFADAVAARLAEIGRDVARGKPQPIFDVDERNGDVIWEVWIEGLDAAMALRPDAWARIDAPGAVEALARLSLLIAAAHDDGTLDARELDALHDRAPAEVIEIVLRLHAVNSRPEPTPIKPAKVGRNDPCPCGSGRKSKRCCG